MGNVIDSRHYDDGNDDRKVGEKMADFSRQIATAAEVLQSNADEESAEKQDNRHQEYIGFKVTICSLQSSINARAQALPFCNAQWVKCSIFYFACTIQSQCFWVEFLVTPNTPDVLEGIKDKDEGYEGGKEFLSEPNALASLGLHGFEDFEKRVLPSDVTNKGTGIQCYQSNQNGCYPKADP